MTYDAKVLNYMAMAHMLTQDLKSIRRAETIALGVAQAIDKRDLSDYETPEDRAEIEPNKYCEEMDRRDREEESSQYGSERADPSMILQYEVALETEELLQSQ